jgi:S1-C subfamily serine protease
MMLRAAFVLGLAVTMGIVVGGLLAPRPASGGEVPSELKAPPAQPTPTAREIARPLIEATRRVRPAVVKIISTTEHWSGQRRQVASGSGFIISKEGHILTNRHVLQGQLVVQLPDGREFARIKVLGADTRSDVAVIRILDEADLPVAALGDSDALEVGEPVIAIGSPFELASSVSYGVVSATGRTGVHRGRGAAEEFIQTDAALNPGNSGGPLINLDGQVVGINTAIQSSTGSNVGIGFSIPINLARTVAIALIETGEARRGWLGVRGEQLAGPVLEKHGIDAPGGFRIVAVEKGSPAERAGIPPGATILEVDGRPLRDLNVLHARLAQAGPAGRVKVTYEMNGARRSVDVALAGEPVYTFGIECANLDAARVRSLGLPAGSQGAVVTRIVEGSVAADAGEANRLLPGDVIVAIAWPGGHYRITSAEDFEAVMRAFGDRPPSLVRLTVVTKDGAYYITLQSRGERS